MTTLTVQIVTLTRPHLPYVEINMTRKDLLLVNEFCGQYCFGKHSQIIILNVVSFIANINLGVLNAAN